MKLTLNWLKKHLETTASVEEIAARLTALGLEVESVDNPAARLRNFVVARVIEAKPHPNADRLRVCTVDTGTETVQVVCGAPNARTGMKGVFAPTGSYIPGSHITLKATEIRGVPSNGMLCSERELELSDEHDGIIELGPDAPVGTPFVDHAGLDNPVIDIAITPNRPDCLGIRGIARDLAAAGLGTLKPDTITPVAGAFKSPVGVRLDLADTDPDACPLFVGRTIRGVSNGPSPKWLQDKLKAIGLRPISALVDITNLLTHDRARPLHVFDADKVAGDLVVRLSRKGETLAALDDRTYTLDDGMCVIADDSGVLSLGGIMGGQSTGCSDGTVNVFVEAALFDPVRTARTGRTLGIDSDARYRFERGVDPAGTIPGMELATRLILELCGGTPSELVIAGRVPDQAAPIPFRPGRVRSLGGLDIAQDESRRILTALGFAVDSSGDTWTVTAPTWRPDIDGEADLVEEILRVHGYDSIPAVPLDRPNPPSGIMTPAQKRVRSVRRTLATRALRECVTWSFLPRAHADLFGGANDALALANPISSELDTMRPSLLPNLITALGRNAARGFRDLGLYEVGNTFHDVTPEGQALVAVAVRGGNTGERHWSGKPVPVDAFMAKADALAVLALAGIAPESIQTTTDAPGWYHPGRSGSLKLGPKTVLAVFGELHPSTLAALDVAGPVVACEVFLDAVPRPKAKAGRSRGPLKASDFQMVERDFAFIADRNVAAEDILHAARAADRALIVAASVFDVYEGPGVPEGRKSVAISVNLQAQDRTLTDEEIEAVAARVVDNIGKRTGATLRG